MERFVPTDAQWTKMEPHCLGKPTDPGRSGSNNRRFVEAVLWIVRTGSPWRDLPPLFGNWNTVFKRYPTGSKRMFSPGFSRPAPTRRTWNTPRSTPPSSRSIATDRAQKGDAEPGHRPLQGRHDDQNSGADRCAGQSGTLRSLARPPLPSLDGTAGSRCAGQCVAPRIKAPDG
jgi:transposase